MSRQSIKTKLKTLLDAVTGVGAVFDSQPKSNALFPMIVISLPNANEERASATIGVGKKRITYRARLTILTIDIDQDESRGEAAFDTFLDAVDQKIRDNVILDAAIGWPTIGIDYIRTEVADPRQTDDNGTIARAAVKEIDIIDFTTG